MNQHVKLDAFKKYNYCVFLAMANVWQMHSNDDYR